MPLPRRQPRDRALIDAQQSRHCRLRLAFIKKAHRFRLLVLREFWRPAEADALLARALDADIGARLDQAALELGQTAQDGEHQPAVRRGGIGPAVVQALERRTLVADLMQDVEQIAGRARQPIEPHDHERVAIIECRERPAQHRAIRMRARQLLGKRPACPCRLKLDGLVMHRLAVCADPGIANYRAHVPLFALAFCIRKIGCYQVLCKYAQAITCAYFCAAALTDAIPRRRQLPASQRSQLSAQPEAAVASGGREVVHEYHDAGISGARSREARPELDEMLKTRSGVSLTL
jgi:hypothetical protein